MGSNRFATIVTVVYSSTWLLSFTPFAYTGVYVFLFSKLPRLKVDLDLWSNRVNSALEKLANNVTKATALKAHWIESQALGSKCQNNANSTMSHECSKMDVSY